MASIRGSSPLQWTGTNIYKRQKEMDVPSGDANDLLSPVAATEFRSGAGCIGYMAFSFRPELAVDCSMLNARSRLPVSLHYRCEKGACYSRLGKSESVRLKYLPGAKRLVGFADSAGPSPQGTQGGRLFALTDEDGFQVCAWIYWESRKVIEYVLRQTRVSFCLVPRPSTLRCGYSSSGLN
jgi:hypothetical protein